MYESELAEILGEPLIERWTHGYGDSFWVGNGRYLLFNVDARCDKYDVWLSDRTYDANHGDWLEKHSEYTYEQAIKAVMNHYRATKLAAG